MTRRWVARAIALVVVTVFGIASPAFAAPATAGAISGVVTQQSDGSPVSNATIFVRSADGPGIVTQTTTASDGTYSVPNLPADQYNVVVSAPGFATSAPGFAAALVAAGQTVEGVNFALVPSATISGALTDASGQVVAGAKVYALNLSNITSLLSQGLAAGSYSAFAMLFAETFTPLTISDWQAPSPGFAYSRADGTFSIDGLEPGVYRVRVTDPGRAAPPDQTVSVVAGTTATMNAVFPAGATVTGHVNTLAGAPMPGITVDIGSSDYNGFMGLPPAMSAITDASGRYVITGVPTGDLSVSVSAFDHATLPPATVKIASLSRTLTVNFTQPGTATISGILSDGLGHGIPNASFSFTSSSVWGGVTTDAFGNFHIDGLPYGTYHALPQVSGYLEPDVPATITVTPDAEHATLDIVLTRGATVSGVVRDPTGHAVFGAYVVATTNDSMALPVASTVTAPDGSYTLTGLITGDYRLTYEAPNFAAPPSSVVSIASYADNIVQDGVLLPLTAATAPQSPTIEVRPHYEGLYVLPTPAQNDGGNPVTDLRVVVTPGVHVCHSVDFDCFISGLKDDTTYVVRVAAVNQVGASAETMQIVRTPPTAPVSAIHIRAAGFGAATISFHAPRSTGGIVDYRVRYYANGHWSTYQHPRSTRPLITMTGFLPRLKLIVTITPVLRQGRALSSGPLAVTTG